MFEITKTIVSILYYYITCRFKNGFW